MVSILDCLSASSNFQISVWPSLDNPDTTWSGDDKSDKESSEEGGSDSVLSSFVLSCFNLVDFLTTGENNKFT